MWHTGARAWLLTQYNALSAARMYHLFQRLGAWVHITMRSNLVNSACSGIIQTNAGGLYVTPTYHVTRAYANLLGDQALRVECAADDGLDVAATRRQSDGEVALAVVNYGAEAQSRRIALDGLGLTGDTVETWTLAAETLEAVNSFGEPAHVAPVEGALQRQGDRLDYVFAPYAVTILRFH
jgi:alpha-L-arabinofuranosidase